MSVENLNKYFWEDLKRDRDTARAFPPGEEPQGPPKWVDERTGQKFWERPGDPLSVDSDGFGYEGESYEEEF